MYVCMYERNDNPLRYSCLGNPMDRGAWQATVQGVTGVGHDLVTKQQQYTYALFHILFHDSPPKDVEYSSLCYIVKPCCLSIL